MMDFGNLMANLPAAMEQVNGVAGSLERIANALERMAKVAEDEYEIRASVYNQELIGTSPLRSDDDPGDHKAYPLNEP